VVSLTTRLLSSAALILGLGLAIPIFADPSVKSNGVGVGARENPGLHLALGHYKQTPSLTLPDQAKGGGFSVAIGQGNTGDLYVHGYRDSSSVRAIPNPEPTTIILLGSGLVGFLAARKRQRGTNH
jgi:hypothetical protein